MVLANVFEGENLCWTGMPKVWQLVGKTDEFRSYVHDSVVRYLNQGKEDAEKERDVSKGLKE